MPGGHPFAKTFDRVLYGVSIDADITTLTLGGVHEKIGFSHRPNCWELFVCLKTSDMSKDFCAGPGGASFGPKRVFLFGVVLSVGVKSFIRNFWKPGRCKAKYLYCISTRFARAVLDIAPKGGLG